MLIQTTDVNLAEIMRCRRRKFPGENTLALGFSRDAGTLARSPASLSERSSIRLLTGSKVVVREFKKHHPDYQFARSLEMETPPMASSVAFIQRLASMYTVGDHRNQELQHVHIQRQFQRCLAIRIDCPEARGASRTSTAQISSQPPTISLITN